MNNKEILIATTAYFAGLVVGFFLFYYWWQILFAIPVFYLIVKVLNKFAFRNGGEE